MQYLEVGKIINTHGLRGEVKIQPWTDTPDVFEDLEYVFTAGKKPVQLTVERVKYQKNNLIVKFREISTIEEAELYKNCVLTADRDMLGALPDGVYYIADLIGLSVKTEDGTVLGQVEDVLQTGANDVYSVARTEGKPLLIPAIPDVVLSVDTDAGEITVRLMEGLLDL